MSTYPIPTDTRRRIVIELGEIARSLDAEVEARATPAGAWNHVVRQELARAAAYLRLTATLIIQGGMDTPTAKFARAAARDYLALVRRADRTGVIR